MVMKSNKNKIKVLVFPAGEVNALELHDALSSCVNVTLYGASSVDRHGPYIFKNYISGLPMIYDELFFDRFHKVIDQYGIDVVFPTHDTVAQIFAENRDRIHARVIAADQRTAEICRDKRKTYQLFQGETFCPKTDQNIEEFPMFIKPVDGQGSVGTKRIENAQEIPAGLDRGRYVLCEYLPGEEYTVDCFTDRHGRLRTVLPRSRKRTLAGISVSSETVEPADEFLTIAQTINQKLQFRGLWWFQVKRDRRGGLKLLEISTRCAGTMCMARALGVNLPLLSVYDAMELEIEIWPNLYHAAVDRTLISRYKLDYEYDTVYFDFDDTLVVDGKVHLPAIRFLYQCRNENKTIILLTKHSADIYMDIKKSCIAETLFDRIIEINPQESKAAYINPRRAIFIDNAYAERKEVRDAHHIPVFDVDAIEFLTDWRR